MSTFTTLDNCPNVGNLAAVGANPTKATFTWDASNGVYAFVRLKARVDSISNPSGSDFFQIGGAGVSYGTYTKDKNGLTPGETYRGQARSYCDPNGGAWKSVTWTPLVYWTQPVVRVEGGTAIANLAIYPNPSRDVFNITFTSESIQDLRVRILNVVGELIISEDLDQFIGEYTKKITVGQSLGSFFLYEVEGIDESGDFVYRDNNNNGIVDEGDRKFFDSYLPKYYTSLNLSMNYKNFDFSTDLFGSFGNQIYNGKKAQRFGNENIELSTFNNRYTSGQPSNTTPRAFNDVPISSDYYLESGDFIRVNNVTLGYTLPEKTLKYFTKMRIYASARNPLIWQRFSGFTPELPGDPLGGAGIELDAYPTLSSFYIGLNTSF